MSIARASRGALAIVVLALLLRQTGVALGIGLVYALIVEGLVFNLLAGADVFKPIVSAFHNTD